jgi:carbon-monoxide dehydrogenase medium subunit
VRGNGTIEAARVVLAVVGPKPVRHPQMEERLVGQPATADTVTSAAEAVGDGDGLEPIGDSHGSADYRRRMARVVARRAVHEAMLRGGK